MATPTEANPFGTPGDLPPVTFSQGHQTFKGSIGDGLYEATVVKVIACVSTFEGKLTPQYAILFAIAGREGDGELCWYVSRKLSDHPKAKLKPTLTALRLTLPTPENPAMPNPLGAKARLLVKNEARKSGDGVVPRIKEVLSV
jgi:hypothetical protein